MGTDTFTRCLAACARAVQRVFLCLAVLWVIASPAHAAITPVPAWKELSADSGAPSHATPLQACQAQIGGIASVEYMDNPGWFGGHGYRCLDGGGTLRGYAVQTGSSMCPANSTLGGGTCTCNSGYAELTGSCVATSSTCPVGQGRTFNRTAGWARSGNADANDIVTFLGPPATNYGYNDGVCVGNLTGIENCWRSQEPSAQGLYRLSCDHTMVVTGTAAPGTGDQDADPTTDVAPCPGFVGEVNGKTVCVGTASSPLPADQPAPDKPTGAGNPAAGGKPPTGPGSGSTGAGRTPSTGTGGNDGGPASAAVGRGGTGPRAEGPETTGEVCGAPPLPACNVKVDETGTPNGSTFGTSPELDAAMDSRVTGLGTARDSAGDASWGIVPAWTFDKPCEPWDIFDMPEAVGGQTVSVDLCPLMPVADGILNFIWAMLGIFAVTGMVAQTMTGRGT